MKFKTLREKLIFGVGAVLFFLLAYTQFFLFPALDNIKSAKKQLAVKRKNKAKLKTLLDNHTITEEIKAQTFEGSLSAFVEKKARELDIKITSIRPYGKKSEGVEIKIEEMTAKELLKFTYEMENNRVIVKRLNARDYAGNGIWVIKFNLEKG